jgi:hypothetical protein
MLKTCGGALNSCVEVVERVMGIEPTFAQAVVWGCLRTSETLDLQGRARFPNFAGLPETRLDVLTLVLTFL